MPDLQFKPWVPRLLNLLIDSFVKVSKASLGDVKEQAKLISEVGGFTGSPFGTMPILSHAFTSGSGRNVTYDMQRAFETYRLDPAMVATLWLRGIPSEDKREQWFSELKDQGWNDLQIEGLKRLTKVLPSAQDVIRFAVREVYSPEIAKEFGQYEDFPNDALPDAALIGLDKETLSKYWAAHWDLPSTTQGMEMLHRHIITPEQFKTLLRALDVMPFWRKKLEDMSFNVLTRVDARRMWDMRVIGDKKLFDTYKAEGYTDEDAQYLVTWTKVYQTFPDLIARFKNGWITGSEVIQALVSLGLTEDTATDLYQQKVKAPVQAERTAPERDLTKAEIIAGVKKKVIDWETGKQELMILGYEEWEADYILEVNINAKGSPETPLEYKLLLEKYKRSQGQPFKLPSPELLSAEKKYISARREFESAKSEGADPKRISTLESDMYNAEANYNMAKAQE